MFSKDDRDLIRQSIINAAQADPRITGGAITGSTARGNEDAWSDIDLGFGVREGTDPPDVLDDFSSLMYRDHGALHHLDVPFGAWIYRVFLMPSTLQVDIAVAPAPHFGARAPSFKLVFGEAAEFPHTPPPEAESLIAWAWLYALHVRSSMIRNKPWQAEYMLSGMRDQVLALACLRHGLPAREARGIDRLPADVLQPFELSLFNTLHLPVLREAFRSITDCLISEAQFANASLAVKLEPALLELAGAHESSQ